MDVAKTWTLPLTNRPIIHGPMWLIPGRVVLRPNRCQLERHRDANQARFVHAHAVLGGGLIRQHKWKHLRGWIISHCASFISAKQRQTGVIKVKYQTRFWEKCFHSSLSWEPNDSQHMYSNHFYFFPVWFAIPPQSHRRLHAHMNSIWHEHVYIHKQMCFTLIHSTIDPSVRS